MQAAIRELFFLQSVYDFEVKGVHIAGKDNRLADSLSRWHLGREYRDRFERDKLPGMSKVGVSGGLLGFTHDW